MTTRRQFLGAILAAGAAFAIGGSLAVEGTPVHAQEAPLAGHFHPKGKAPSQHIIRVINEAKATLPFADTRDFEEQARGLIAERSARQIMADADNVAFDRAEYDVLDKQEDFDSIHPSTARIGRLNNNFGLYEVVPGIYQVRGMDLVNITFIRGKTGWIAYDVGTVTETARAAWELFQEHVGEGLPVTAVIYSHTHADRWGGVRALVSPKMSPKAGSRSSHRGLSWSSRSPRTSLPGTR